MHFIRFYVTYWFDIVSVLNRRFEDHLETSVSYRQLTQLIAREVFIEFSRRQSSRAYITYRHYIIYLLPSLGICVLSSISVPKRHPSPFIFPSCCCSSYSSTVFSFLNFLLPQVCNFKIFWPTEPLIFPTTCKIFHDFKSILSSMSIFFFFYSEHLSLVRRVVQRLLQK
jgi:hypothetical protein